MAFFIDKFEKTIMKYENYYYIDGHVEIEGNLGTVRLLKPYRMLPYWNERAVYCIYT